MHRRFVQPLLPSPTRRGDSAGQGSINELSQPELLLDRSPVIKKRRIGVSVACNSCRRKKIRCDGKRPTCSHCAGQTARCEYRDEGGISPESKNLIVELFSILGRLQTSDVTRVLAEIRKEEDAIAIVSIIRDRSKPPDTPGGLAAKGTATSTAQPIIDASVELNTQDVIAYSDLSTKDTSRIEKESSRALTKSTTQDTSSSQNVLRLAQSPE